MADLDAYACFTPLITNRTQKQGICSIFLVAVAERIVRSGPRGGFLSMEIANVDPAELRKSRIEKHSR